MRILCLSIVPQNFDENLNNENNDIFLKYLVIQKNKFNDFGKFLFFSFFVKWIFGRFFCCKIHNSNLVCDNSVKFSWIASRCTAREKNLFSTLPKSNTTNFLRKFEVKGPFVHTCEVLARSRIENRS